MVLKAFLFFSQQPKLEGGKWERKHFRLIFLQVMLPVRLEGLPDTGEGQEELAQLHIHVFGGLGTTVWCAEAVIKLPIFFFFFSQQQAYNKGNEKNCMKDPVSNLPVYHGLPKNLTKHMCNSNQTVPFCIWNKLVKYLTQFQRDIAPNWKATLELSVQRRQLGHQCKDLDSHFHDLCVLMNLTNCGQPHLGSASIHSLHLGLGASCKPRLTLHAWTMAQKYLRPCVFAGLDSLAVLPTSASNATHHPALAWFCKLICQWKVLLSTTQSTALWYSWTLVTGSAHP